MTLNIRFCQTNLMQAASAIATASSTSAGFPVTNAFDTYRYRAWRPGGRFVITAANQQVHINDGVNVTANVAIATYTSGAALATAIATALNVVSTLWTCTYSTTTGLFTIFRTAGAATIRLTVTTNAIWDTIGFTSGVDTSANPVAAVGNVRRNHTSESIIMDLGSALEVRAFHVIGPASVNFSIASTAVVTLKGNSAPVFAAPVVSLTLTPEQLGIFRYIETTEVANTTFRYWEFEFQDRENPNGPFFSINQIYLGNYLSPATRNVNIGLQRDFVDDSRFFTSEGGVRYFRRIPRYYRYSSTAVDFLIDSDRLALENLFATVGTTTPLFISYDPGVAISNSVGEFTKYMQVESASVKHELYKYHTIDFAAREVV